MLNQIKGLHHVTSLAADARSNNQFFTDVLGLRRVKKTVNFDDPSVYHLYYGDELGTPGTVMTYFLYANRYKYDVLCQFDGDGQHVASELKTIVEPIINNRADYVIGSRYLGKDGFKSTAIRRVGIKLFSTLISRLTGLVITDATSGFRAYGDVVIKYFALNYRKEIYDVNQLLLLSYYNGARVTELPVTMKERMHGKSEFDFTNSFLFPLKGVINIIGCILEYKAKIRVA